MKSSITNAAMTFTILALCVLAACGSKQLTDLSEEANFLDLSAEQMEIVQPKLVGIQTLADQYSTEKAALEKEFTDLRGNTRGRGQVRGGSGNPGARPAMAGMREKMQALQRKRTAFQTSIDASIKEIRAVLNEEQLEKFEQLELPELEEIEQPNRGQGRGAGGPGGGGRGGGGMKPPGGMGF